MASIFTFITTCALIFEICYSLDFPEYSFRRHPMYTLPQFKGMEPKPVAVKKYYCSHKGFKTTSCAFFAPASASYDLYPSKEHFASDMDALFVHGTGKNPSGLSDTFLEIHLNRAARVVLLINGKDISQKVMQCEQLKSVTGLDSSWKGLKALRSKTGRAIPVGDLGRTKNVLSLPALSAAVESIVGDGEILRLPHPQKLRVNGNLVVTRYNLLFLEPDDIGTPPRPFLYPPSPAKVRSLRSQKLIEAAKVHPNRKCPTWLHDLHMTDSRDPEEALQEGELLKWRTWHAMIDPIWWCYYDHEHGAYPGLYKPAFDYTAWKTYDASTAHNRQDESHGGFKVFSFPLHDAEKFVVIVVHMHVAFARRFFARHHTVSFTVLDKEWELEMELHMKMDFGGAEVTFKNRTTAPVNDHEDGIIQSLLDKKVMAGRRFNVLNADDYPNNVDKKFLLNCGISPNSKNEHRALRGIYEQWKGPLNTCSMTSNRINKGFNFDVRDPSTAMRSLTEATDKTKQIMLGYAVNRILIIPTAQHSVGIRIGIEYCDFDMFRSDRAISLEQNEGVFHTDPYFSYVEKGPGRNAVRQFIKPEFETIVIKAGKLTPLGPWAGHLDYQEEKRNSTRQFRNIEGAVRRLGN